jgi:prephenate dehydrogenase
MMFEKAAVLGVGLIGASLALAMKGKSLVGHVVGHGRSEANLKLARERGIIDSYELDAARACRGADLVVYATPVGAFKQMARSIKGSLKEGAIAIDVGSVKGSLVRDIEGLSPEGAHFVACHPIAGSESSGIDAASGKLFEGRLCIICRTERTDHGAFDRVSGLWRAVGSRIEVMDPFTHDKVFGLVSHLPHVIAYALMNTVADVDPGSLGYAGNGFKDTTRIAASSPAIWRDICALNRGNLLKYLDAFKTNIDDLLTLLRDGDLDGLEAAFERARGLRRGVED